MKLSVEGSARGTHRRSHVRSLGPEVSLCVGPGLRVGVARFVSVCLSSCEKIRVN